MSPENILTAFHFLFPAVFAAVLAYAARKVLKRRNTYNAWLLPFAYLSFVSWISWFLQYLVSVDHPLISFPNDVSESMAISFGVVQNMLWAGAILSFKLKPFSRVSLTLLLLVMVSIVIALVITYLPVLLTLLPILVFAAVIFASIFLVLALSIPQWPVNRGFVVIFCIYGFCQWVWIYVWLTPWGQHQIVRFVFPLWYFGLLITWICLISKMLVPYSVMISSTVDLSQEPVAVDRELTKLHLETLRAETIGSRPDSPDSVSESRAKECHLFILITGERYGPILESKGMSAVEFEYQTAWNYDHGKILVYTKNGVTREPRLEEFVRRLTDSRRGHSAGSFTRAEDLSKSIPPDVKRWIKERREKIIAEYWS